MMAVIFKIILIYLTTRCLAKTHADIETVDAEKWLKSYQEVAVTFVNKGNVGNEGGHLYFEVEGHEFSFELAAEKSIFSSGELDVIISPETTTSIPLQDYASKIRIFTGLMKEDELKYRTIVKVTDEGIDCIVFSQNEIIYILEPASRYLMTSKTQKEHLALGQFHNIFYKANDVINPLNSNKTAIHHLLDIQKYFKDDENNPFRHKRAASPPTRKDTQTECILHILADHIFYQNTGRSNILNTISEMSYYVLQADLIFRGTDFDGNGIGDNIGFHISKITVFTTPDSYIMDQAVSVDDYLNLFSEMDFSGFCLASVFTSRDFEGGTVGLAWVASSNPYGPSGGICQHRILYGNKKLSLNTNLVTNVNAGRRLPAYLSSLTLAHEFGHSFGSPHDDASSGECFSDDNYGNFLMYPYLSDGNKPNNDVFSPCSINSIYPVIRNKGLCFVETITAICGNGFRETSEECDCGTSSTCYAIDPCCTPVDVSDADPDNACTFRRSQGARCSFKESHCCSGTCQVVAANAQLVCKADTECTRKSICDGVSASCPAVLNLPDTTPCAGGKKSCKEGICKGNVCATQGSNPCQCSGIYVCYSCCFINNTSECRPFVASNGNLIFLPVGSSCNDREGICDGIGKCVMTDPSSAMDRLGQMFTGESVDNVNKWLKYNWYYILLALLFFAFLTFVFVRTCRSKRGVQTSAYMAGRFVRIQGESDIQQAYLARRKELVKAKYEEKIKQIGQFQKEMDFPKAVARLMVFFPATPMDVIMRTLRSSVNEESAVRLLLTQQQPFRRVCTVSDICDIGMNEEEIKM